MFKIVIELDEKRMAADGFDLVSAWEEIEDMILDSEKLVHVKKGEIITDDFGMRGWFIDLLKNCPWFMKYVCKWEQIGPNFHEDMIKGYNEMGVRCCYV